MSLKAETAAASANGAARVRDGLAWLWPVADAGGVIAPLDGLRGIAVLLVVAIHLFLLAPGPGTAPATVALFARTKGFWAFGVSGVNLFFILSGFLLFLPYGRALLNGRGLPSSRTFYIRRALRILPAYWTALLLIALLFGPREWSPARLADLALHVALLQNWSAATFYSFNVPFWTMAVEAQFYLLLPLLAAVLAHALRGGRRRLGAWLLGLVVLASPAYGLLAWGAYLAGAPWATHVTILNVLGYLTVFGLGAGCSLVYLGATENRAFLGERLAAAIPRLARAAGVLGLGLLAVFFVASGLGPPLWDHEKLVYWLAGDPLLAFGYAGILLGALLGWPAWRAVLAAPALRFAGVISYSLYIWHYPLYEHVIMPLARTTGSGLGTLLVGLLLTAVITIPCSFVFYTCVERPFLRVICRPRGRHITRWGAMSAEATTSAGPPASPSLRSLAARLWPVSGAVREIAALDGLRAVAVLLVMGFHWLTAMNESPRTAPATLALLRRTGNLWVLGVTGVHLFFVLSGFLLFLPYARALLGRQEFPATRKFYARRALRILPAYWVSLVLIVLVFQPQYLRPSGWGDLAVHAVLLQNVTATTRSSINPPFWTMAVESQFYVLLPILAGLLIWLVRTHRRAWAAGVFLALPAASLGFNGLLTAVKHWLPAGLEYIDTLEVAEYLGVFGAGLAAGLAYVAATETAHPYLSAAAIRRLARLAGAAGLVLILADILLRIDGAHLTKVEWLCYNLVFGAGYAGVLVGTLLGWQHWAWLLSRPALRFLGVISYSLYIWHELFYRRIIVPLASSFSSDVVTLLLSLGLTVVLLIPFCWGFYHVVERPFIRARRAQH